MYGICQIKHFQVVKVKIYQKVFECSRGTSPPEAKAISHVSGLKILMQWFSAQISKSYWFLVVQLAIAIIIMDLT